MFLFDYLTHHPIHVWVVIELTGQEVSSHGDRPTFITNNVFNDQTFVLFDECLVRDVYFIDLQARVEYNYLSQISSHVFATHMQFSE